MLAPIVMNMLGRRQQHAGGGLGFDYLLGSLLGGGAQATGPRSQAQGLDDLLGLDARRITHRSLNWSPS